MNDTTTQTDLERHVKHIAGTLTRPETWVKEYAESHLEADEPEDIGAMEWLEDVLDIRYIVGRDKEFISAQVLVAFGGPNIWVNFDEKMVRGYWGGEEASAPFQDTLDIEDTLADLYDC